MSAEIGFEEKAKFIMSKVSDKYLSVVHDRVNGILEKPDSERTDMDRKFVDGAYAALRNAPTHSEWMKRQNGSANPSPSKRPSALDDVDVNTNTMNGMRGAIKAIAKALGAAKVSGIALTCALFASAAEVVTAPLGELDLDSNPAVVVDVSLEGLATEAYVNSATNGLATETYVDSATNALSDDIAAVNASLAGKADSSALDDYASAADLSSVGSSVSAVWEQVYGENVWMAVTNYLRTTSAKPSMGLWERRGGTTNLVWSSDEEITAKVDGLRAEMTNAVAGASAAAEDARAWGKWQSADGSAAPADFTMVTTPNLMLTGGGRWEQRTLEGGGSYWLFCGAGSLGGTSDGGLKMTDSNGETVFEVTKGSTQVVSAIPESFKVSPPDYNGEDRLMSFTVKCDSVPKVFVAASLEGPWYDLDDNPSDRPNPLNNVYFYDQANISVKDGKCYILMIDRYARNKQLFFRAVYETGAESVVDFKKILKFSRVQVSNTVYRASVGTMSDGTKFLKLEDE